MKPVDGVTFKPGTKEELLPDFDPAFPYIATCAELRDGSIAPWHWHQTLELFYMEEGSLEYTTPSCHHLFPAGSAGLVNVNVPHTTRTYSPQAGRQLLHLFDPCLISGHQGSRVEEKYVLPLVTAAQVELIPLHPEDPHQAETIRLIRDAFRLSAADPGYELHLRSALSGIWLRLLETAGPQLQARQQSSRHSGQIRQMMVYAHEHYGEKLTVTDLARSASISERACFALFQSHLRMTPMEYLKNYRLQMACRLLTQTRRSVSDIAAACALGSSSYFSRTFHESMGCTPLEYRNRNKNHQE